MIDGIVHIDFKAVPEESWPFATLHFTGSKAHNIKMRQRALQLGYSLSEYGFKDKEGIISNQGCQTEEDIFKFLRMPYKEPWDRNE
jgi:DNA polymerase (family 10)